jgi:hypothetical protein
MLMPNVWLALLRLCKRRMLDVSAFIFIYQKACTNSINPDEERTRASTILRLLVLIETRCIGLETLY